MTTHISINITSRIRLAAAGMALAALAGCAGLPERVATGTPREQVLQALGTPTATYPMPEGGTRLQYSRQPSGRQVHDVDLDAAGRVTQVRQVLQLANLNKVPVDGSWREADVLREFGVPAMKSRVRAVSGEVWSYRYEQASVPYLFHVDIDPQGVVRRTYSGIEPIRPWVGGD